MWSGASNPWAGGGAFASAGLVLGALRGGEGNGGSLASHAPYGLPRPCKSSQVQWECESLCDGHCAAHGQCCAFINTYVKTPGKCECYGGCGPCDGTPVKRV